MFPFDQRNFDLENLLYDLQKRIIFFWTALIEAYRKVNIDDYFLELPEKI